MAFITISTLGKNLQGRPGASASSLREDSEAENFGGFI